MVGALARVPIGSLGVVLLLLVPGAAATFEGDAPEAIPTQQQTTMAPEEAPPAPQNLTGAYNAEERTVQLTWEAPGTGLYTYHVYRNASHIATTSSTNHTDALTPLGGMVQGTYHVTASGGGQESSPSNTWSLISPPCDVVIIIVDLNKSPFVHPGIDEACIPRFGAVEGKWETLTDPLPVDIQPPQALGDL